MANTTFALPDRPLSFDPLCDWSRSLGIIYWTFSQLISYGVSPWALFLAIAFAAAYFLGVPGMFLGHILIAIAVVILDVQWIQAEMRKPGWNGQPDQDFVFAIGVVLRILLINTVLMPVSLAALRLRRSRRSHNPPLKQVRRQDPLHIHREWCRGIEAVAQEKAGRALTLEERNKIWNCGSFMWLEVLERDVAACQTPEELERYLAKFPFLGPLPPEYTARD